MALLIENRESAFNNGIDCFAIVNNDVYMDLEIFLNVASYEFAQQIMVIVQNNPIMKVQACLIAKFEKFNINEDSIVYTDFYGATKMEIYDIDTVVHDWYDENVKDVIMDRVEKFAAEGSGWKLSSIIELQVTCCRFTGFRGASYIVLPKGIKNKSAIINVQNSDEFCFKYVVLSKFLYDSGHKKNCQRVSKYRNLNFLNELNI